MTANVCAAGEGRRGRDPAGAHVCDLAFEDFVVGGKSIWGRARVQWPVRACAFVRARARARP